MHARIIYVQMCIYVYKLCMQVLYMCKCEWAWNLGYIFACIYELHSKSVCKEWKAESLFKIFNIITRNTYSEYEKKNLITLVYCYTVTEHRPTFSIIRCCALHLYIIICTCVACISVFLRSVHAYLSVYACAC